MPFLSMVRRPALVSRRLTQRFSLSTKNRRDCRFGRKRRFVLLFACDTWWPTIGALPVTWHTRAMARSFGFWNGEPAAAGSRKAGNYALALPFYQALGRAVS